MSEATDVHAIEDGLHEFVVRWLYNGPQGHLGAPPPTEARANLDTDAANAMEAVRAWLAIHPAPVTDIRPHTTLVGAPNPILGDALTYYAERRSMNNPKGWTHVLRKVEQAIESGLWTTASADHIDGAREVLRTLVAAEDAPTATAEAEGER